MEVVGLSVTLGKETETYPGDPEVSVERWVDWDDGGYMLNVLRMGEHTGTHVDAPAHVFREGRTVDLMPPETFIGRGIAVDVRDGRGNVRPDEIPDGLEGLIVLFAGKRELSVEAARKLVEEGVKAVGVEVMSVGSLEVHRTLLGAGIPVYENLRNVSMLIGRDFTFLGLPLKIEGGSGSPVRAVAVLGSSTGELLCP